MHILYIILSILSVPCSPAIALSPMQKASPRDEQPANGHGKTATGKKQTPQFNTKCTTPQLSYTYIRFNIFL